MITLGGNAELELVDSMDPFSEGIIFSVMPPKKSWRNISNLSGGEKVLWCILASYYSRTTQSSTVFVVECKHVCRPSLRVLAVLRLEGDTVPPCGYGVAPYIFYTGLYPYP